MALDWSEHLTGEHQYERAALPAMPVCGWLAGPIVLFVYQRPTHCEHCRSLIRQNEGEWLWAVADPDSTNRQKGEKPYKTAANAKRGCERWLKKTGRL